MQVNKTLLIVIAIVVFAFIILFGAQTILSIQRDTTYVAEQQLTKTLSSRLSQIDSLTLGSRRVLSLDLPDSVEQAILVDATAVAPPANCGDMYSDRLCNTWQEVYGGEREAANVFLVREDSTVGTYFIEAELGEEVIFLSSDEEFVVEAQRDTVSIFQLPEQVVEDDIYVRAELSNNVIVRDNNGDIDDSQDSDFIVSEEELIAEFVTSESSLEDTPYGSVVNEVIELEGTTMYFAKDKDGTQPITEIELGSEWGDSNPIYVVVKADFEQILSHDDFSQVYDELKDLTHVGEHAHYNNGLLEIPFFELRFWVGGPFYDCAVEYEGTHDVLKRSRNSNAWTIGTSRDVECEPRFTSSASFSRFYFIDEQTISFIIHSNSFPFHSIYSYHGTLKKSEFDTIEDYYWNPYSHPPYNQKIGASVLVKKGERETDVYNPDTSLPRSQRGIFEYTPIASLTMPKENRLLVSSQTRNIPSADDSLLNNPCLVQLDRVGEFADIPSYLSYGFTPEGDCVSQTPQTPKVGFVIDTGYTLDCPYQIVDVIDSNRPMHFRSDICPEELFIDCPFDETEGVYVCNQTIFANQHILPYISYEIPNAPDEPYNDFDRRREFIFSAYPESDFNLEEVTAGSYQAYSTRVCYFSDRVFSATEKSYISYYYPDFDFTENFCDWYYNAGGEYGENVAGTYYGVFESYYTGDRETFVVKFETSAQDAAPINPGSETYITFPFDSPLDTIQGSLQLLTLELFDGTSVDCPYDVATNVYNCETTLQAYGSNNDDEQLFSIRGDYVGLRETNNAIALISFDVFKVDSSHSDEFNERLARLILEDETKVRASLSRGFQGNKHVCDTRQYIAFTDSDMSINFFKPRTLMFDNSGRDTFCATGMTYNAFDAYYIVIQSSLTGEKDTHIVKIPVTDN